MSDFTSNFWSIYIAAISVVSVLACALLLWLSGKTKVMSSKDNTTGHVWDGDLREMNNPLPRWWVWLFVLTIVFAAFYFYMYPGLGTYPGAAGWTSTGQHAAEVKKGDETVAPLYAKFTGIKFKRIKA